MKKILVVVAHPNIGESKVNKRWIEALSKYPERFTLHEIYKAYPDGKIDVLREQALIESHQALVLQFPLYWFNCPPLLKQWLDEVFTYGWAYGTSGDRLKYKKIMLAVSAGIQADEFSQTGKYKTTLEQVLIPFQLTAQYVKADYQLIHALYDAQDNPTDEIIDQSAFDYIEKLKMQ